MEKNNNSSKFRAENLFILILLYVSAVHAAKPLSSEAQISLLIGEPNNTSIFSIFGHASLRVNDPELNLDYILNYGVFDSSNTENILHLIKGNLYCELWVYDTPEYLEISRQKGVQLREHILNLTPAEKETLWQHLIEMGKSQKGMYHYDIFRTNCATLPLKSIEGAISGGIVYANPVVNPSDSYSVLGEPYLNNHPWPLFLSFLFFGDSIYDPLTFKETLFLPGNLEKAFESATITIGAESRPLIQSSHLLIEGSSQETVRPFFTPQVIGWILFLIIISLSLIEWKKKKYFRVVDYILFGIAGIFGLIIFLLNTVFVEWYTWFGYNLIWLHPLHLVAIVLFANKKLYKQAYYYHIFNLLTLAVAAVVIYKIDKGVLVIYEKMVAPYMLMLTSRSVFGLIRYYRKIK